MRVFVVEDSAPVRERLIEMIDEIGGFEVVGQAATFQEAVLGITRTRPDIAIFDIQLGSGSGIE
jgi:DNA-binding NarL/FixJ family response regulator